MIKDYRDQDDLLSKDHETGDDGYQVNPPVVGPHNPTWQNCQGEVYDEPIAGEHAARSLEHGAAWITYRPGVRDTDHLM